MINQYSLFEEKINIKNIEDSIRLIKKKEWKYDKYKLQSWGHPLHKIAPYVGRIKPSFAHFLIKYLSKENQLILDPFCGIGTICLEASLLKRKAIGFDINPYAFSIAKAKMERKLNLEKTIDYINSIKINYDKELIKDIPNWVKNYYNEKTLIEIIYLLKTFKEEKKTFIYACLVAISQGHRPGHLSKPCGWTIPYTPRPDDPGEYRDTKLRLVEKIIRNYKDVPQFAGEYNVYKRDSRKMNLKDNSVDLVISSPPYYNTLDYVGSNRLRLAIMGFYEKKETDSLKKKIIQSRKTYLTEMSLVINELNRVMKKGSTCCFVVGDLHENKKIHNTSEDIIEIMKNSNFIHIDTINDEIPKNKSVLKTTDQIKKERIILLKKN